LVIKLFYYSNRQAIIVSSFIQGIYNQWRKDDVCCIAFYHQQHLHQHIEEKEITPIEKQSGDCQRGTTKHELVVHCMSLE
jgi:hypothetical protein